MGNALKDKAKLAKAIEAFKKVLSIKPDYEIAIAQKLRLLAHICDWDVIKEDGNLIPLLGTTYQFISPFSILSLEEAPERHRIRSEIYAKARYPQKPLAPPEVPSVRPKRIWIGYFSTNFKEYPFTYLIGKILEQHNCDEFTVFANSLHGKEQIDLRQRLVKSFDYFLNIQGISDKDIALRARQDKIDIAIDLTGYTTNNHSGVFAYRVAPIQVNYLGYPGTIGAVHIDHIVADQNLILPENQKYFTEKQIYLPNTYMTNVNTREISTKSISKKKLIYQSIVLFFVVLIITIKLHRKNFIFG